MSQLKFSGLSEAGTEMSNVLSRIDASQGDSPVGQGKGTTMAMGLCRIKDGWSNEDSVRVRYEDGKEMEMPASQYQAQGYAPSLDQLQWCADKA